MVLLFNNFHRFFVISNESTKNFIETRKIINSETEIYLTLYATPARVKKINDNK